VIASTRRNFPSEQTHFGLKTPPDPHVDRSAQSLREPRDPGVQHVTVHSVPSLRPCMEPPARSSQPLMKPRENSEQPLCRWKPPPLDCGSQPLITPPDCGLPPTTPSRRPGIVTPLSTCFMTDAEVVLSSLSPSPIGKFGRRA